MTQSARVEEAVTAYWQVLVNVVVVTVVVVVVVLVVVGVDL